MDTPEQAGRKQPRVAVYTLGCKLNQIESESIADAFRSAGADIVPLNDYLRNKASRNKASRDGATEVDAPVFREIHLDADSTRSRFSIDSIPDPLIVVINTCTVTSKAEQKARRVIRRVQRDYPQSLLIVTGCYTELDPQDIAGLGDDIAIVSQVDKALILDMATELLSHAAMSAGKEELLTCIRQVLDRAGHLESPPRRNLSVSKDRGQVFRFAPKSFSFHARAHVKIQDGCDNRCAYCRVTLARGDAISRDPDEIIAVARQLDRERFREIVLTGVNISSYRCGDMTLPELTKSILRNTSVCRIRLSSIEPDMWTAAYDDLFAEPRICPHLHLPVQSGSDRVLLAMRRKYRADHIRTIAQRILSVRPNTFLAADFICGFPGETTEDHLETVRLLHNCEFTRLHVFPFSPRPGTEAFSMAPKVPEREIDRRTSELRTLSEKSHAAYRKRQDGCELEVVAETRNSRRDSWFGVSGNYLRVEITGFPQDTDPGAVPGSLCSGQYEDGPDHGIVRFRRFL